MKNRVLVLMVTALMYGCGESTTTTSTTSTSTPNLQKEMEIQNKPNTSVYERLSQSQNVLMCGDKLYELDNGRVRFYRYTSLGPDNVPVFQERNPSIVGPMNFDSNTNTYTWKIEYKIMDKDVTAVEQLVVNNREMLVKDSMTNQVNKINCMTFEEFNNQLKSLPR